MVRNTLIFGCADDAWMKCQGVRRSITYNSNHLPKDKAMANLLERKELLMANTIQIDTMYQLLIQKGYFTGAEFLVKRKEV